VYYRKPSLVKRILIDLVRGKRDWVRASKARSFQVLPPLAQSVVPAKRDTSDEGRTWYRLSAIRHMLLALHEGGHNE